ncbi:MAG: hypothetical protein U1E52_09595 [Geminicoccaceae bacterium]
MIGLQQQPGRFADPEAVISDPSLAAEDKRAILEDWRRQAHAEPATDLVTRIGRALAMLDTETGAHQVTHDQGFYTSVGDIGKTEVQRE